jgi:hypothetical protein
VTAPPAAPAAPATGPSPAVPSGRIEGPQGEANLRAAARLDAASLASLPNGTRVAILGQTEGDAVGDSARWYEVEVASAGQPAQRGFVHSSLVRAEGAVPSPTPRQ